MRVFFRCYNWYFRDLTCEEGVTFHSTILLHGDNLKVENLVCPQSRAFLNHISLASSFLDIDNPRGVGIWVRVTSYIWFSNGCAALVPPLLSTVRLVSIIVKVRLPKNAALTLYTFSKL